MLRYGVIGTNWITDWWVKSAHASGSWQLSAVYSRTEDKAKAFADKYGVTKTYTSITDLVTDADIDVIYIASPNSLHYEHAKQCILAHKHVILEKPATSTCAELDELFSLAYANEVFLIEAYRHIHEANFHAIKAAVLEDKLLGPVYGASLNFASFSSRYHNVLEGERPNIFTTDFSGGSLVDVGVYPVSFAVALWGRPKSQTYHAFICPTGVDGGGFVVLQYEDFSVQINQSKVWTSTAPSEIYGEKGTLSLNGTADIKSVKLWSNKTKETQDLSRPPAENNMQEEAEEMAKIISRGDRDVAAMLEKMSKDILAVTADLRRQAGVVFKVEQR